MRPFLRNQKPHRTINSTSLLAKSNPHRALETPNYKIYTYLESSKPNSKRVFTILDTGAGPNILRSDLLPKEATFYPLDSANLESASVEEILISGIEIVELQIGDTVVRTETYVSSNLKTAFIVGCHFCYRMVESIRPHRKLIEFG